MKQLDIDRNLPANIMSLALHYVDSIGRYTSFAGNVTHDTSLTPGHRKLHLTPIMLSEI